MVIADVVILALIVVVLGYFGWASTPQHAN